MEKKTKEKKRMNVPQELALFSPKYSNKKFLRQVPRAQYFWAAINDSIIAFLWFSCQNEGISDVMKDISNVTYNTLPFTTAHWTGTTQAWTKQHISRLNWPYLACFESRICIHFVPLSSKNQLCRSLPWNSKANKWMASHLCHNGHFLDNMIQDFWGTQNV